MLIHINEDIFLLYPSHLNSFFFQINQSIETANQQTHYFFIAKQGLFLIELLDITFKIVSGFLQYYIHMCNNRTQMMSLHRMEIHYLEYMRRLVLFKIAQLGK